MSLRAFYSDFFTTLWLAWAVTWLIFSLNVKATVRRQATVPRLLNTALMI